jgi:hypothetical protein
MHHIHSHNHTDTDHWFLYAFSFLIFISIYLFTKRNRETLAHCKIDYEINKNKKTLKTENKMKKKTFSLLLY